MPRRGLPTSMSMRHDEHYVEALAASAGTPVGRLIPIDLIDPNPNQPRQVMGDLSELIASIGEKGILEPLLVRPRGERFQIVAGERRYQAAVQVGLFDKADDARRGARRRGRRDLSVAAHCLYEQNPDRVAEPEGVLLVPSARYEEIDERRTRVSGAQWIPASRLTVKLEGTPIT